MKLVLSMLAGAALLGAASLISDGTASAEPSTTNRLTYYVLRGTMYSGYQTHWGAAACSWNYPIGTVLELPDGFQVTCLDRGLLGSSGWIDIWAPDHATGRWLAQQYGDWTPATVVRWGW
jgi:hypothetical protein